MKVVINKCYGGFGLSPEALLWLNEQGYNGEEFKTTVEEYYGDDRLSDESSLGFQNRISEWRKYLKNTEERASLFLVVFTPDEKYVLSYHGIERNDPLLIKCVETLGQKANGQCADLSIVEIPNGVQYSIEEYDGIEHIAETHRTWG